MRNIDCCSCGCGCEPDTDVPGTPGPDGEDFVDNDYLFATESSPEWYDADEHAGRRYVQPDPEINEYVYSVAKEACRDDQCSEPCEELPDCGDACNCCGAADNCGAVCEACGCGEESTAAQNKNRFNAGRVREDSIRRNQARALQRRKALQGGIDADERMRRRENALRQSASIQIKSGDAYERHVAASQPEPEISCLPDDLCAFSDLSEAEYAEKPKKKPVDDGYVEDMAAVENLYTPAEDFISYRPQNSAVRPTRQKADDIYGKAERFAQENIETIYNCGCASNNDGQENGCCGNGNGKSCECCCKGEDCYAPDYYACELEEDCCDRDGAYLMQGSFGDEVRTVQRCIKRIPEEQGGTPVLEIDGIYGPNTAMAVMRFQEQHDIPADGVTNKKTRARMQTLCQSR